MRESRPELRLLGSYPDLEDRVRESLAEAFMQHLFLPPSAIISATDGTQQFREEGRAAAIAIRRSDLREIEKPGPRSDGKLILWVNDRAIAPQHAELVFDGREWNLRNEGDAPVTILPAGPRVDPGGAPYRFDRDLRFRIRDWEFQFAGGDPERQALGEIQIEKAQDRTPGLDTCAFRAFGCVVELGSPRGFWSGRGDQLPAVVEALCDAVAARCGRGAAGPVTMLRDARLENDTIHLYRMRLVLGRVPHVFELSLSNALTQAFLDWPMLTSEVPDRAIRWKYLVCGAGRRLRVHDLKRLGPGCVLILEPDSGCMLDTTLGREWPLRGSGSLGMMAIGEQKRQSIRTGGVGMQTEREVPVDVVPVRIQVVAASLEVSLGELQKFAPGQQLAVSLTEGSDVGIAINGKILGQGRLVKLATGQLGVQVRSWNV